MTRVTGAEIKVVGKSGQIALGKSFAGKALRVEHARNGSIVLTPVAIVRESQLWTVEEPHRSRISRGLSWASSTEPRDTRLETLLTSRPKGTARARGRKP